MSRAPEIRVVAIIRDAVIIYALTFVGGLIVGLFGIIPGTPQFFGAIAILNLLLLTVGFTISGYLVGGNRWKHLLIVTLALWLLSFSNVLFGVGITATQVAAGIIPLMICMGIGGSISYLLKR